MGCSESKVKSQPQQPQQQQQSQKAAQEAEVSSVGSDFEDADPPPPPPKPKKTYRASKQLLGKGGSAVVFAGVCIEDRTPVAIKRVHISDEPVRAALAREYETLQALPDEPHVVKVFHFEAAGEDGIIVLELVRGGTLRRLCKAAPQRRLHESAIRLYMRDCLIGLRHLHRNRVIHRDIKSDNILVNRKVAAEEAMAMAASNTTDEVLVKLTDFGSCKNTLVGGVCQTTVNVVGTVPYMAPEAVRGKFSFASDVWALAITFVELATPGQNVWSHLGVTDAFALLLRIGSLRPPQHMPPLPAHLSSDAREIIQACLAYDPAARPSCDELLRAPYFAGIADGYAPADMEPLAAFAMDVPEAVQAPVGAGANA